MIFTDRSRFITYQDCQRRRWLAYHAGGQGFRPRAMALALGDGTYIHHGLGLLLTGASVDAAVGEALEGFTREARDNGIIDDDGSPVADHLEYVIAEQRALLEALLRVYATYQLPKLLSEFEILEVEREDLLPLGQDLQWMARADFLARHRVDGDLYVGSYKTAGKYDARTERIGKHDVQGLSEACAIESRLGEKFYGIKMEYLVKGDRKEEDGVRRQNSYLIRPWMRQGAIVPEWAWSYYWTCQDPHIQIWKNGRQVECKGGKKHGLGDSYSRVNIWEVMPVKEWIEMLASGTVQPFLGDPFVSVIIAPVPYFRNEEDVESWRRQAKAQELRVSADVQYVRGLQAAGAPDATVREALDRLFIQHKHACDYPSRCPYQPVCFEQPSAILDPSVMGYVKRVPHHESELIQLKGAEAKLRD